MLLFGCDRELARWASERLGEKFVPPFAAIGVARHGAIVAVAIYNNYRPPNNIEITFVTSTPRWASRHAIGAILRYPFGQLGCRRITAVTAHTNSSARAFLERLGFRQEGYHPMVFADADAVSYGLMKEDAARWLA